jgi:hypothetical protein
MVPDGLPLVCGTNRHCVLVFRNGPGSTPDEEPASLQPKPSRPDIQSSAGHPVRRSVQNGKVLLLNILNT